MRKKPAFDVGEFKVETPEIAVVEPVEAPVELPPAPMTRKEAFAVCDAFVQKLGALIEGELKGDDPVLVDARREAGRMVSAFGADLSRLYGYIAIGDRPKP